VVKDPEIVFFFVPFPFKKRDGYGREQYTKRWAQTKVVDGEMFFT
jgi:hypothetical protein